MDQRREGGWAAALSARDTRAISRKIQMENSGGQENLRTGNDSLIATIATP